MLSFWDDFPKRSAPRIFYTHHDFEGVDDPAKIRWRAYWADDNDALPAGIELRCYPVVRKTPCGAWIDPYAYRYPTAILEDGSHMAWNTTDDARLLRFVYDRSNAAWAKPTRDGALRSLGIRLCRWSQKLEREVARMNAACDVADVLLSAPDFKGKPDHAVFWTSSPASVFKLKSDQLGNDV